MISPQTETRASPVRDQSRGTGDFCVVGPEQLPMLFSCGLGGNSAPPEAGASPAYGSWRVEAQPCPHLRCGMCLAAGTVRVCRDPSSGRLSQDTDGQQRPCCERAFCSEPVSNGMEHALPLPATGPSSSGLPGRFLHCEPFP